MMKYYYLLAFMLISSICVAQEFDINQISQKTRDRITTYYNDSYKYEYGTREIQKVTDEFYQFLEDSTTTKELKSLIDYDHNLILKLYDLLINRPDGFTKIELLKREMYKTDRRYQAFYGCMPPPPSEPKFTFIGKFLSEQTFSNTEKDSLHHIIFNTPNQLQQLQGRLLLNMENQSKYIDMIIPFVKRTNNYIAVIPLMKYRFEEEKELILELLEKWLNHADATSMYSNYLSNHFKEIFSNEYQNKEIRQLLLQYIENEPHHFYYKDVIDEIATWKDSTALRSLSIVYEKFVQQKITGVRAGRDWWRYDYKDFIKVAWTNRDTVYKDWYYTLLFDKNTASDEFRYYTGHNQIFQSFLLENDAERYLNTLLKKYRKFKDQPTSTKYPFYLRYLRLQTITSVHPDTAQGFTYLLEFLSAENDGILLDALNCAHQWLKKYPYKNITLSNRFYEIMNTHEHTGVVETAVTNFLLRGNEIDRDSFLVWYKNTSTKMQNIGSIKNRRNRIIDQQIRKKKKEEEEMLANLVKTKDANSLLKIIKATSDFNEKSKIYELIHSPMDTIYSSIYWYMLSEYGEFTDEAFRYFFERDSLTTSRAIFKQFDKTIQKSVKDKCYCSLYGFTRSVAKHYSQDTVFNYIYPYLNSTDDNELFIALRMIVTAKLAHDKTSKAIFSTLYNSFHNTKNQENIQMLVVFLSYDKSKKTRDLLLNWYQDNQSELPTMKHGAFVEKELIKNRVISKE